ncbi:DUF6265 family protein [Flavobacterium sp.]|uniref:DUF6265 family protein n=1 Tax=Flavobacterium sp. TaxID=239 RepID=UPI003D11EC3C
MKKLIFIASLLTFLNCNFKKENKHFLLIEQATWLLGNWTHTSQEGVFTERWEKLSDSTFVAESLLLKEKDTLFHENVLLEQRNDSLFYIVSIKNEEPTSFYATTIKANQIDFSNPKHDFPNLIRYQLIKKDSILASIHGKIKTKIQSQEFPMRRKK